MRTFFNLALGPEEPSEVHFLEKCRSKNRQKNVEKQFPENVQNPFSWTRDTQISHLDNLFCIFFLEVRVVRGQGEVGRGEGGLTVVSHFGIKKGSLGSWDGTHLAPVLQPMVFVCSVLIRYIEVDSQKPPRQLDSQLKTALPKNWSQKIGQQIALTHQENWKINGPNGLSKCPESREMDFGPFRETYFSTICLTVFWTNSFRKNGPQKGPQRGSHKLKKVRILILQP